MPKWSMNMQDQERAKFAHVQKDVCKINYYFNTEVCKERVDKWSLAILAWDPLSAFGISPSSPCQTSFPPNPGHIVKKRGHVLENHLASQGCLSPPHCPQTSRSSPTPHCIWWPWWITVVVEDHSIYQCLSPFMNPLEGGQDPPSKSRPPVWSRSRSTRFLQESHNHFWTCFSWKTKIEYGLPTLTMEIPFSFHDNLWRIWLLLRLDPEYIPVAHDVAVLVKENQFGSLKRLPANLTFPAPSFIM